MQQENSQGHSVGGGYTHTYVSIPASAMKPLVSPVITASLKMAGLVLVVLKLYKMCLDWRNKQKKKHSELMGIYPLFN